jgi:hypothetical protein
MLVHYRVLRRLEDIEVSISRDAGDLLESLDPLGWKIQEFSCAVSEKNATKAYKSLIEFQGLVKELEAITSNLRENYEGYLSATLPNIDREEKEEEEPTKAPVLETDSVATLMGAIEALSKLKESVK